MFRVPSSNAVAGGRASRRTKQREGDPHTEGASGNSCWESGDDPARAFREGILEEGEAMKKPRTCPWCASLERTLAVSNQVLMEEIRRLEKLHIEWLRERRKPRRKP